jgi:hypothetical protein
MSSKLEQLEAGKLRLAKMLSDPYKAKILDLYYERIVSGRQPMSFLMDDPDPPRHASTERG